MTRLAWKVRSNQLPCAIPGCTRRRIARGWCGTHWWRWKHHGLPDAEVFKFDGNPRVRADGYAWIYVAGVGAVLLHRLLWELERGPIPDGFEIHHINGDKLDNRMENFEILSGSEHATHHGTGRVLSAETRQKIAVALKGNRHGAGVVRRQTHCPRGHLLEGSNLYVSPAGIRRCRTCHDARTRESKARHRGDR